MHRGVLGVAAVGSIIHRMNEIGNMDEEDGDVVADEIENALVGAEFGGEAAHVAGMSPAPPQPFSRVSGLMRGGPLGQQQGIFKTFELLESL
jgi:hypothetical protein